jgi:hypothetical protein
MKDDLDKNLASSPVIKFEKQEHGREINFFSMQCCGCGQMEFLTAATLL